MKATVFLLGAAISVLVTVQAMKPSNILKLQPHLYPRPDERVETPPPEYSPCTPPPYPPPPSNSDCCSKVWNIQRFNVPENRCPREFVEGIICALNVQRAMRDLEPLQYDYEISRQANYWVATEEAHRMDKRWMSYRERRYGQASWALSRFSPCYGPIQAKASNVVGYFYQRCTNFHPTISDGRAFYQYSPAAWNYTRRVGVGCDTWQKPNGDQMLLVNVWFDHPSVRKDMEADNEEIAKEIKENPEGAEEETPEVEVPQMLEGKEKNEEGKKDDKPVEKKKEEKKNKEKEEKEEKEEEKEE